MTTNSNSLDDTFLIKAMVDIDVPAEVAIVDMTSATAQVVMRHLKQLHHLLY